MKLIEKPLAPVFGPGEAVAAIKSDSRFGKVIGYWTKANVKAERHPALLICLSSGAKRDQRSHKPAYTLWGFIYLDQPAREPKFVAPTAEEAITFAMQGKADVALFDSLDALLKGNKEKKPEDPPECFMDFPQDPAIRALRKCGECSRCARCDLSTPDAVLASIPTPTTSPQ